MRNPLAGLGARLGGVARSWRHRAGVADDVVVGTVPGTPAVRLVTDSTACLPADWVAARGVRVVPLRVITPDGELREGVDTLPREISGRLAGGQRLSTSQPPPADFGAVYEALAAEGAREIVSVHLAGSISGTVSAARVAAANAPVPVTVVDSGTTAMALGLAVQQASLASSAGAPAAQVAARAAEVAGRASLLFLVDSLDHLRRGGRITAGRAALAAALGVRPILELGREGVVLLQRVRTRRAAIARLASLAVERSRGLAAVAVAVHHLDAADRAAEIAQLLAAQLGVPVTATPASAVLAVHAGPGAIAVVITDVS
ncbi:MAG: DegV family protein [Promicromonosporaceae bacterium]|nr:DegV family protein [Promicromonosporaceae bacterium]